MCENSDRDVSSKRFPLRTPPESTERFPFRDLKYYTNPQEEEEEEMKSRVKSPRLGYMAQRSIEYLESTGRKPDLHYVPWFKGAAYYKSKQDGKR